VASPGNYNKLSTRSHERSQAHKQGQTNTGAGHRHRHRHGTQTQAHLKPSQFPDPGGNRPHGHTHTPRRTLIIHNSSYKSKDRVESCCSDDVFVFGEICWPSPRPTAHCILGCQTNPSHLDVLRSASSFSLMSSKCQDTQACGGVGSVFSLNFAIAHLCGLARSVLG